MLIPIAPYISAIFLGTLSLGTSAHEVAWLRDGEDGILLNCGGIGVLIRDPT